MGGPSDLCSDRASYVRWVLLDHVYAYTFLLFANGVLMSIFRVVCCGHTTIHQQTGPWATVPVSAVTRLSFSTAQPMRRECDYPENKRKVEIPIDLSLIIFGLLFLVWLYNAVPAFCVARMSWWMSPSWPRGKGNGPKPMNCSGCSFSR